MQLLADNDAMDAHIQNLFQNYFWESNVLVRDI